MNQAKETATENSAPTRITIAPDGDWELWICAGKTDDGFEWKLPLKARPFKSSTGDRLYFIHHAMNLNGPQYDALVPVLDAWDYSPKDERGWWFKEDAFKKFASHAPGLHPEYYTAWPNYTPPKFNDTDHDPEDIVLDAEPGFSASELNFLKKVHFAVGENISWEAFKIIWLAVRKQAIQWLASDLKTLDLGFAKIAPVPYRANWKESLCVRFQPRLAVLSLLSAFRRPRAEWHEHFSAMGLYNALASAKLLALNCRNWSKPSARWSLEILPSPDLHRAMEEHEAARENSLGPARYAARILKLMASRLNLTLEILKHYTEAVRLPPAAIKEGNQFGTQILTPMRKAGQVRPGTGLCESLQLCPEEAFQKFSDEPADEDNAPRLRMNGHPFKQLTSPALNPAGDSPSPSNDARRLPAAEPNNRSRRIQKSEAPFQEEQPGDIDVEPG